MAQFDVDAALSMLNTQTMGRKIIYQAVTGTTMDDALNGALKQGQPHGTAYLAEIQTEARGSKGRQWNATNTGNLYVSFIIHRDVNQSHPNPKVPEYDLDISGALATMLALEEMQVKGISIKWLNDLWIRGHKLCGALAEDKGTVTVGSEQKQLFILGIGLNVNSDIRRDTSMYGLATSTLCETGREFNREKLFSLICQHLEELLVKDRMGLYEMYTERQTLQTGQWCKVTRLGPEGGTTVCKLVSVNHDWTIDLEEENGEVFNASWTTVSIRPCPEHKVYILTGPQTELWSSQLLTNSLNSLIDTTRLLVRSVVLTDEKGFPDDCSLLVIGQLKQPLTPVITNLIRDYVKRGGACICIGNGCSLFASNGSDDCVSMDHLQMDTIPFGINAEGGLIEVCLPAIRTNANLAHNLGEPLLVLGHRRSGPGNANTAASTSSIPGVAVYQCGKGKVCLSSVNVEVNYAHVEELFPKLIDRITDFKNGMYHQDNLILKMLQALGF